MGKGTDQYDRMLNAGFCGIIVCALVEGASGKQEIIRPGFPLVLAYLLAPMILHRRTAERISHSSDRGMAEFLTRYPDTNIGLEHRIANTVSNIRAGLSLALTRGAIQFDRSSFALFATGAVKNGRHRLTELLTVEDDRRVAASLKLGRWTTQMSISQLCNALAIRPVWRQIQLNTEGNGSQTASSQAATQNE